MAQDEKMLVPVEPTDAMVEVAVDAFPRSHPSVFPIIYRAMLSAAPAQPAAVAGEPVAWAIFWRHGVTTHPTREAALAAPGRTVQEPVALYARPSPTPAADADADEMAKAVERLKADADYFDHPEDGAETHRRALCWVARDIRTVLGLAALKSTPPADDALRVALKALEYGLEQLWSSPPAPPRSDVALVRIRIRETLAALKAEKK